MVMIDKKKAIDLIKTLKKIDIFHWFIEKVKKIKANSWIRLNNA